MHEPNSCSHMVDQVWILHLMCVCVCMHVSINSCKWVKANKSLLLCAERLCLWDILTKLHWLEFKYFSFFWSTLGYIILFSIYLLEEIKHVVIHLGVLCLNFVWFFPLSVHIACYSIDWVITKGPDLQTLIFHVDHKWEIKEGVSLKDNIYILTVLEWCVF